MSTYEQIFNTPGTYTFTAPEGVTSVHVVCVGGGAGSSAAGAGGGGGLGWKNNISVTPGDSYTVVVGARAEDSYFIDTSTVKGGGASGRTGGGRAAGNGGGNGGTGGSSAGGTGGDSTYPGGGGAGGYSGNGGNGSNGTNSSVHQGSNGAGGGGGGGAGWRPSGGGGVGIFGEGPSGVGGIGHPKNSATKATGGSGGASGGNSGGQYGGGGYGSTTSGASGAVRIIWGEGRAFPSTNVGDDYVPPTPSWTPIFNSDDLFLVNSGDTSYKVKYENLFSINSDNLMLVYDESTSTSYKVKVGALLGGGGGFEGLDFSLIANDDRFLLVNRGSTSYKVKTTALFPPILNITVEPVTGIMTNSSTLDFDIPVDVPAGTSLILTSSSRAQIDDNQYAITDSQGNTWQSAIQGTQNNNLTNSTIFYCTVTTPLTTSDYVRLNSPVKISDSGNNCIGALYIANTGGITLVDTLDARINSQSTINLNSSTPGRLLVTSIGTGTTSPPSLSNTNDWILANQGKVNGSSSYQLYAESTTSASNLNIEFDSSPAWSAVQATFDFS